MRKLRLISQPSTRKEYPLETAPEQLELPLCHPNRGSEAG